MLDIQFLNITDLLVLRGDKAKHESVFTTAGAGYHHAIDLQEKINNFNKGIFVDGSEMKVTASPFSYGCLLYTSVDFSFFFGHHNQVLTFLCIFMSKLHHQFIRRTAVSYTHL